MKNIIRNTFITFFAVLGVILILLAIGGYESGTIDFKTFSIEMITGILLAATLYFVRDIEI